MTLTYLISLAVTGLIVGALGRLAVPGPNPLGCLGTILAGLVGAFLAGIAGRLFFDDNYTPGLLASIIGAAAVVYLFGRSRQRRRS